MKIKTIERHPTLQEYKFLHQSVGWKMMTDHAIEKAISASIYTVLAGSGDQIVGMGSLVGDGGNIYLLADIIVLPAYQGQGIGKSIVHALMEWIKKNGTKGSILWLCAAKGREGFYEKLGFEKGPIEGFGAGMRWEW